MNDPYEIARRIARDVMMVDLEQLGRHSVPVTNIRDALLAAIEEGRRMGAEEKTTAMEQEIADLRSELREAIADQ